LSAAIPPFIIRHFLFDTRYFFLALIYAWFVPARTGFDIHESYGRTESASMVTYNHYHRHVVGSVGTPVNLIEVQIRDFDGKVLEPGAQGEICICCPNITQRIYCC
jgi:long-subunit acyl-CoA synthetase (AMP-forming)